MKLSGWGNYPVIDADIKKFSTDNGLKEHLRDKHPLITRGSGRSYGDSSLNKNIISLLSLNSIHDFDENNGTIKCDAGVSLDKIIDKCILKGWFLSVTPGTKFITVGGAIASDVHGKNHHKEGSFSDYIVSMDIMLPGGMIIRCSRVANYHLFLATCGGMGLTGIILNAVIRLKRIETAYIKQKTIRARNIYEMMELFEQYNNFTYSIAWIDCLSKGEKSGRGILMLGEHATTKDMKKSDISQNLLKIKKKKRFNIPFMFPDFTLNKLTVKIINVLIYNKHSKKAEDSIVDYDSFFYPVDGIHNWNRIYGKRGFTEYQFVLPKNACKDGIIKILRKVNESKMGSFFAGLKLFGKENANLISFPMEGFTLALDFPISSELFAFLDQLDEIVTDYGGRLYLTKDARMSAEMFKKSYNKSEEFIIYKHKLDKENQFQSLQSKRLNI
ncbi:dehydrogenase [Candidatus Scalindua japonica]|uniref:Dehydrogenase n=1 Tax=Candidatus Scalindua japonica TaxID=1284222 RepID=A0A286U4F2_9BACT|nr:FAD-binding oxidoreductase [Candidatus Scalindua japonica]GAX63006.1 dehydrogenase [Candidatus Scalindua japonica]